MAFEHYDKCSLLLPMDGANNGTVFTDWSPTPKTVTANGTAKTSTTRFKYYDSSGLYNGTGDYLTVTHASSLTLSLASTFFTGVWVYVPTSHKSGVATLTARRNSSGQNGHIFYMSNGEPRILLLTATGTIYMQVVAGSAISVGAWNYLAFSWDSTTLRLFVNDTMPASSSTTSGTYAEGTNNLLICRDASSTSNDFAGNIQDLFISKGDTAVTASFTPPTRLVGTISGNVKDAAGNNASRIIHAVPRSYPSRMFSTISDPSTGNYSLSVPATECSRIALADETTLYNDIVDRVIPE